ncbi:hypothetical protein CTEN210_06428 [Chaetoceros tenuissimus]|uniref:RING-type E3 ubiquitin transferase n=1 Tax=Chaetoceros tenuissimus TaxID=426638 RepID=A0AAD3H460_9STRA|nr:hypothetical protein CTEN210_06428 [Chaetoceros tenuissimus]
MQTIVSALDTSEEIESSREDDVYTYEYSDDDDDPFEKRYYDAKALKGLHPNRAMENFQSLIDTELCNSSIVLLKFKSMKQMTKLKLRERDYSSVFDLYKRLLEYICTNTSSNSLDDNYASNSIEKMLNRIFAVQDSGKESYISFAHQIYNETFGAFNTIRNRKPCKPNERLWIKVTIQYSYILYTSKEEDKLATLVRELSQFLKNNLRLSLSITNYNLHPKTLIDVLEIQLCLLQKDESSLKRIYELNEITLGCLLSDYQCELGLIHQNAGEIYMKSSTAPDYDKAYSSFSEACKCYRSACDLSARVRCLKMLYIIKMLQGSSSGPQEISLEDIRPSDFLPTLVKIFDAFQREDIQQVEKLIAGIDEKSVEKEFLAKVRLCLQKKILLKELPETSKVHFWTLYKKLNHLPYSKIIDLINIMKVEKKLKGQVIGNQYVGSQFQPSQIPAQSTSQGIIGSSFVAENNQICKKLILKSTNGETITTESAVAKSPSDFFDWPNPDEDCIVDIASTLTKGITNIILEARAKYPSFAQHIDITSFDFDELGQQLIRFLNQQVEFKARNVSSFIDSGIHYTKQLYAASIRSTGLRCSVSGRFGPGIYTGNNCKAFAGRYGNVGLILLRLQGKTGMVDRRRFRRGNDSYQNIDTVIGNARTRNLNPHSTPQAKNLYEEVILQSTSQCVPVIIFDTPLGNTEGEKCIEYLQESLQNTVDSFLNVGSTPAGYGEVIQSSQSTDEFGQRVLKRQRSLYHGRQQHLINYNAPNDLTDIVGKSMMDIPQFKYDYKHKCPICLDELGSNPNVLRSLSCSIHIFHHDCIRKSLEVSPRCPMCKKWVKEPQGMSPSGTMRITIIPDKCSGYLEDTIVIYYQIKGAIQKSYHSNPDVLHSGKNTPAYLPNNDDGKKLLKRLKYAFEHGLTFTVGTSLTTGLHDQCTWASIHHKTSLSGGTGRHGYPDVSYFLNCNEELDGLGVPPADDLPNDIDFIS